MYLAIVATNLDDVPILLTPDLDAARHVLKTCTLVEVDAVCNVLGRDTAGICTGLIVRFANGKLAEFVEKIELPQFEVDEHGNNVVVEKIELPQFEVDEHGNNVEV
jgi:hypothetical protein